MDSFKLTEKWQETKATLQGFKNIGLSISSKPGSRSQSVLPNDSTFERPNDELKPYFTKMIDGRQVFIEDKVIFPKLLKQTMKMNSMLNEQKMMVDDIHHEISSIDH